jgi:hypothetical protein
MGVLSMEIEMIFSAWTICLSPHLGQAAICVVVGFILRGLAYYFDVGTTLTEPRGDCRNHAKLLRAAAF